MGKMCQNINFHRMSEILGADDRVIRTAYFLSSFIVKCTKSTRLITHVTVYTHTWLSC